ncbi:MAG: hypothetical protein FWD83_09855 [Promicromonosporaceae bacterium]|nr:hypothetical protein [Promicromonosporaceae bacterium]
MPSSRRSSRRPYGAGHVPIDTERALGGMRLVSDDDGDWSVRTVKSSDKTYRCPACNQEIRPGTAHVVAWSRDGFSGSEAGVDARRHWHASCWQRRARLR